MFAGQIEQQHRLADDVRKLRIERLRQVREQEKVIANGHASEYKEFIGKRKRAREDILRDKLLREERTLQRNLAEQWQRSLIDTGHAHRTAMLHKKNRTFSDNKNTVNAQRMASVEHRGKVALEQYRNVREANIKATTEGAKQRLNKVREMGASDREDARAAAEAKAAGIIARSLIAAQNSTMSTGEGLVRIQRGSVQQGALKVQERGVVTLPVQAVIQRHTDENEHGSFSMFNNVGVAEEQTMKKRFGLVLRELQHRKVSTARARIAQKTLRQNNNHNNNNSSSSRTTAGISWAEAFESDLALLSSVDNAAARAMKRRNAIDVARSAVTGSVRAFESVFFRSEHPTATDMRSENIPSSSSSSLERIRQQEVNFLDDSREDEPDDDDEEEEEIDSIGDHRHRHTAAARMTTAQPRPPAWVIPAATPAMGANRSAYARKLQQQQQQQQQQQYQPQIQQQYQQPPPLQQPPPPQYQQRQQQQPHLLGVPLPVVTPGPPMKQQSVSRAMPPAVPGEAQLPQQQPPQQQQRQPQPLQPQQPPPPPLQHQQQSSGLSEADASCMSPTVPVPAPSWQNVMDISSASSASSASGLLSDTSLMVDGGLFGGGFEGGQEEGFDGTTAVTRTNNNTVSATTATTLAHTATSTLDNNDDDKEAESDDVLTMAVKIKEMGVGGPREETSKVQPPYPHSNEE